MKALGEQIGGSFFTANPPGAEHGDSLVLGWIEGVFDKFREVAEVLKGGDERPFKTSNLGFIDVPGVNYGDLGIADQGVPFMGWDVRTGGLAGVDPGNPEGDNFLFDAHPKTPERGRLAFREFCRNPLEFLIFLQPCQKVIDGLFWSGDGGINPFARDQDNALEAQVLAGRQQHFAPPGQVRKRGEFIKGGDGVVRHFICIR